MSEVEKRYLAAKERYAKIGVDTDEALKKIARGQNFDALLARRRCEGIFKSRWRINGRHYGNRKLSGRRTYARTTSF